MSGKSKTLFPVFLFCIMHAVTLHAQDDLLNMMEEEDETVAKEWTTSTFKTTRVINAHSVENLSRGVLDFRITHRFGNIGGASGGGVHTLYGFDNASNIRLSLEYGINDRLMTGIGRSKTLEHIDGFIKWKILRQTTDDNTPLSLLWMSNAAVTPAADPEGLWSKTAHRFSYVHQLILGRKFSDRFSLEILPTYFHRNFVRLWVHPADSSRDQNGMPALGAAFRIKVSPRTALIAEYFHVFSDFRRNNTAFPFYAPLALGVEIETGGHVFHINLSNASGIIENDFLANSPDSWSKGGMKLGFTISRTFQILR